jgi:hypothetical protein
VRPRVCSAFARRTRLGALAVLVGARRVVPCEAPAAPDSALAGASPQVPAGVLTVLVDASWVALAASVVVGVVHQVVSHVGAPLLAGWGWSGCDASGVRFARC